MAHLSYWAEVVCEYDDCDWVSDMGKPDDNMMWNQYREHKKECHSHNCKGCMWENDRRCYGTCAEGKAKDV